MKPGWWFAAWAVLGAALLAVLLPSLLIADSVTVENINAIEPGMAEEEVVRIFGRPPHDVQCMEVARDLVVTYSADPMFYRKTWQGNSMDVCVKISMKGTVRGVYRPVEKKTVIGVVRRFLRLESH